MPCQTGKSEIFDGHMTHVSVKKFRRRNASASHYQGHCCCIKRKHNVLSSQFYCSHSRYSAKVILFTFMSIQNHIWHNKMQTKIIIDSVGHIYIFPSLSNWRQRLQKSYFTWRAWTNEPKQSVSLREEIWKRKSQGKFQVVSLVSSFFVTAKQVHFPILNTQQMIL